MWELVQRNKRRSLILAFFILFLLVTLGALIGYSIADDPAGVVPGVALASGVWGINAAVAYFQGGRILLAGSGARKIQKADAPRLFNVVEEMTIAAALPKMPDVYIIDDPAMNAFATGRDPDHAAVAVTSGLLNRLNRDQLQGVIAHEIGHILHRDVLFMTMLGVMVGTIILISDGFARGVLRGSRYRSGRKGDGGAAVILLLALVLAVLAPILAQLLYFAVSRRREYLADARAAVLTRYPEGLASALEAIESDATPPQHVNRVTAPMYIVNPLQRSSLASLFATHPPTALRIRALRSIGNSVSWQRYQETLAEVDPASAHALRSVFQAETAQAAPVRTASEPEPLMRRKDTGDLLRRLNQFQFISCECGAELRVPPDYNKPTVRCPRCGRTHPRN